MNSGKVMNLIPKKYRGMIEEVYKDSDGYWAYAREGYIFRATDCGTAHGETQAEFLRDIRTAQREEM